jgi:hypothetical protein
LPQIEQSLFLRLRESRDLFHLSQPRCEFLPGNIHVAGRLRSYRVAT